MDEGKIELIVKHKVNNYLQDLGFNVGSVTTEISYMKEKLDDLEKLLKGFIDKADEKYARNESVRNLWKIVWAVIAFVFVGI